MNVISLNLEDLPLNTLKQYVAGKNPVREYELELVRRITQKDYFDSSVSKARDYFLTDFSYPFLDFIAVSICKEDNARQIQGEYYEFVSMQDKKTQTPYYRVSLYKGITDASLSTYVSTITTRYFISKRLKDKKIQDNLDRIDASDGNKKDISDFEMIENPWFAVLISQEDKKDDLDELLQLLNKALNKLPEREKLVLQLMIMDDATALEAFEDLEPYIEKTAKSCTKGWTDKQKQDAISLLKGRALIHLQKIWKTLQK